MIRRMIVSLSILWLSGAVLSASEQKNFQSEPRIRILLAKDVKSAYVEARGNYSVRRRDTGTLLSSGNQGKRFIAHAIQDGIRWGEEYPDVFAIAIVPEKSTTTVYVNGIQYKGALSIYHAKDNRITIVNDIPIEDYLKSTLAMEFDGPLSKEAMAALVISARTNAYLLVQGRNLERKWDVVASQIGYAGYGVTKRRNGVDEMVDQTRHIVLHPKKAGSYIEKISVSPEDAQEFAARGFDAKQILETTYPHLHLSLPERTR